MNKSGKKEPVIICCLTTEVVKVVEPAKFYEASRVHIVSYPNSEESDPASCFYNRFLKEARARIEENPHAAVIVEYANIMDYQEMLRTILRIVSAERERNASTIIYVNISSGTPEYIAGAMLASMQDSELIAFSVRTKSRSMNYDQMLSAYTVDGRTVGNTAEVNDPIRILTFGPEMPEDRLVACLEIIKSQDADGRSLSFGDIINRMKDMGIWDYTPEHNRTRTDDDQKERMYLKRNFIIPMMDKEWIIENYHKRNKFLLTEKGEAIVAVYGKE